MRHDPDQAVAKGAALYGTIMATLKLIGWEPGDNPPPIPDPGPYQLPITPVTFVNVASRSYGIRVLDSSRQLVVCNLIRKQDQIPAAVSREFPVSEDNAAKLPLKVYENESLEEVATEADSSFVGETEMLLTPGLPKGSLIRITFKLGEDGVLAFEALDITNNKNVQATFTPAGALTQQEIEAAREITGNLLLS